MKYYILIIVLKVAFVLHLNNNRWQNNLQTLQPKQRKTEAPRQVNELVFSMLSKRTSWKLDLKLVQWPKNNFVSNLKFTSVRFSLQYWRFEFLYIFAAFQKRFTLKVEMEPEDHKKVKKVSFAMEDIGREQRWKKTKTNTQIFFSASMMTSKRARARSSSILRQSIVDSTEKNIAGKIDLHQVNSHLYLRKSQQYYYARLSDGSFFNNTNLIPFHHSILLFLRLLLL